MTRDDNVLWNNVTCEPDNISHVIIIIVCHNVYVRVRSGACRRGRADRGDWRLLKKYIFFSRPVLRSEVAAVAELWFTAVGREGVGRRKVFAPRRGRSLLCAPRASVCVCSAEDRRPGSVRRRQRCRWPRRWRRWWWDDIRNGRRKTIRRNVVVAASERVSRGGGI